MRYIKSFESYDDDMKDFIKHSYAFIESEEFFENLNKESILILYKELDYVYDLLESLDVVSKYSKNRNDILKGFDVVNGMGGDVKYLTVGEKSKEINIKDIIYEIFNLFTKKI